LIADVTAEMLEESDPHELVDFTDLTGRSRNALHTHLDQLVEANLVTNWKQTDPDKHQTYSRYAISGLGARPIDLAVESISHEKDAFEDYQ
jgi:predicted ArsR family transcriptional regulator